MTDRQINVTMWLVMVALLGWFTYFKGWILDDFQNISPQKAHELLEKPHKILLLDVRSQEEFKKDHINNAINIPLETLDRPNCFRDKDESIMVYSERGERSVEASRILSKRGFKNILNLEGGVVFWIRAGYEVVR